MAPRAHFMSSCSIRKALLNFYAPFSHGNRVSVCPQSIFGFPKECSFSCSNPWSLAAAALTSNMGRSMRCSQVVTAEPYTLPRSVGLPQWKVIFRQNSECKEQLHPLCKTLLYKLLQLIKAIALSSRQIV